jgi:carboxymethylenebutenolidase
MAVRQHITVGREDDAGAGAAVAALGFDLKMEDRGPDLVDRADDGARIRIERGKLGIGRAGRCQIGRIFDGVEGREMCRVEEENGYRAALCLGMARCARAKAAGRKPFARRWNGPRLCFEGDWRRAERAAIRVARREEEAMGRILKLTAADGHTLGAYRADPADAPKGGVVVLQEIFGVNAYIHEVCDDYAKHGYSALAPALYDRLQPDAAFAYSEDGMKQARALRVRLDWEKIELDVAAAIGALRPLRVGTVGYCLGGSVSWLAACRLGVEAASCYYPTDIARQYQDQPRCPVVVHFAKRDHIVGPDTVEKFKVAHPEIPAHIYEADHGFNCWKRPEAGYDPASSALALDRTLNLFERCLAR